MNRVEAEQWLDGHINLEATAGVVEALSLDRMRALVDVMGEPQRAYPVVHVTGTNGKGSTARIVARLLEAYGLRVGLYTSPHLERVNERLVGPEGPIDDASLAAVLTEVSEIESLVDGYGPLSYFELLTAAAYGWFADAAVDAAVVEVGLLGRWDATNVADAIVAIVTNIGRDHTDGRAGWREAIAREKAGIVKPGCTLVLGETDQNLTSIFDEAGAATIWRRDEDFGAPRNEVAVGGRLIDLETPSRSLTDVFLGLHGAHQGDNAAAAAAAAEAFFGRPLEEPLVLEALAQVEVAGRFEIVGRHPLVVLDGAHNPDSAEAAARTLLEDFEVAGQTVFVVGMLDRRDPEAFFAGLGVDHQSLVIACTAPSPRSIPASIVAEAAAAAGAETEIVPALPDALQRAVTVAGDDDAILVTGSLYVVGAARPEFGGDGPGLRDR